MTSFADAIRIALTADGTQAISEFKKVGTEADKNLKKAQSSSDKLGSTLTKVGVGAATAGIAIGAGLFKAAEAASKADLAHRKLLNTIHNSPALVGASTAAFDKQAESLEKTTVYSHVQTTTIQALLGQYKLTQGQILQLTPLVEDFASKMGIDTVAAAKAVGKAVEGTGGGLQRYGIITGVTKKGTDNFNLTMNALRKTVGGFAGQEGKTFAGQLQIVKNEMKHVEEEIGAGAIPVLRTLGGIVGTAAHGFLDLDKASGGTVGTVATWGAVALVTGGAVSALAGTAIKLGESLKGAAIATRFLTASESEAAAAGAAEGAALDLSLGPIGAAALAVTALAAAYYGLTHSERETTKFATPFVDYTQNVKGAKLATDDATQSTKDWLAANSYVVGLLNKAGISQDEYTNAVEKGGKAYDDVKAKGEKLGHFYGDIIHKALIGNRNDYVQAANQAKVTGEQQAEAADKATQGQVKLNHHIQDGRESYRGYSQATQDAAEATGESGTIAGKTADDYYRLRLNVDAATESMFKQANAANRLSSDALQLGDDQQTLKDDTKAYNDELKKGPKNADAIAAANRKMHEDSLQISNDLLQNKQDAIDYAVSMTHGAKDTSDAIKNHATDFVRSLQKEADSMAPGSPTRVFLEQYIGRIKKGIPDVKTTHITADTSQADRAVSAFINSTISGFASLGVKVDAVTLQAASAYKQQGGGGGTGSKRAGGGPVEANKRYLVGEEGPELFVPNTSGTIVPHGKLRSAGGGGGGGDTYVTQHITITNPDPSAVADAILKHSRYKGTRWIKDLVA